MLGKLNNQSDNATIVVGFPSVEPFTPSELASGGVDGDRCAVVLTNLAGYIDGELNAAQVAAIEKHLDVCADCSRAMDNLIQLDGTLEREWRDSSPLPSSFEFARSIDSIMETLPEPPRAQPTFTPKRVHARARWMRFAGGLTSIITLLAMLWSTYCIGYRQGLLNRSNSTQAQAHRPPGHNPTDRSDNAP